MRAPGRMRAALFGLFSKMGAGDAFLQILERAQVLDDVAAGIIEEDLAVLVAPYRDQPIELVAILEQVVDGLGDPAPRYDGDLGLEGLLLLCHQFSPCARCVCVIMCALACGGAGGPADS